jgi:hypothetical protein
MLGLTLSAIVVGTWLVYRGVTDVRRRVALLDANPCVGPVDWGTVFLSPTLMRAAWHLSSNPRDAIFLPFSRGDQISGLLLLNRYSEHVDIQLRTPVIVDGGRLHVSVVVKNLAETPLLVPPMLLYPPFSSTHEEATAALIHSVPLPTPVLGSGARLVQPGQSKRISLSVKTETRSVGERVIVAVLGRELVFPISENDVVRTHAN